VEAVHDLQALVAEAEAPLSDHRTTLLGNAQNPLDHLVGDVAGRTDTGRYFIVEFKRYAHGFVDEVGLPNGKPDRIALFGHLLSDPRCNELSKQGHFGAYFNHGETLFGVYFDLTAGVTSEVIQLSAFFDRTRDPNFAWSRDDLFTYITCMTDHGVELTADDGQIVFGYFDQSGRFVAMSGTLKIFAMIHEAFKRAHTMQNPQKPVQSHTKPSTPVPRPRGG
jgi:hypothetical protein